MGEVKLSEESALDELVRMRLEGFRGDFGDAASAEPEALATTDANDGDTGTGLVIL